MSMTCDSDSATCCEINVGSESTGYDCGQSERFESTTCNSDSSSDHSADGPGKWEPEDVTDEEWADNPFQHLANASAKSFISKFEEFSTRKRGPHLARPCKVGLGAQKQGKSCANAIDGDGLAIANLNCSPSRSNLDVQFVARALLGGDMKAVYSSLPSRVPKAFTHSLIHECALAGCLKSALWCVDHMVRMGQQPNVVTFNTVLNTCAKSGNVDVAEMWWQHMVSNAVKPNAITYNTIIRVCAKSNRPERAEHWIQRMVANGFVATRVSITSVISAFASMGNTTKCDEWLHKAFDMNVRMDPSMYNSLMKPFAIASDVEGAERLFQTMRLQSVMPNAETYTYLINACMKRGDRSRATRWYFHLESSWSVLDDVTFGNLKPKMKEGRFLQQCANSPW
jgi:pentatricopeptide repeat protein